MPKKRRDIYPGNGLGTRPVRSRHCNACGGGGKGYHGQENRKRTCIVCRGKGYWDAEDIRLYHLAAPNVCKQSCGDVHHPPSFLTADEIEELLKDGERALAEAKAFLDKKPA